MTNVILVVDEIDGFLGEEGALADKKNAVVAPGTRKLVRRKIPEGWEAFFLCDNHTKEDPELQILPEHCMAGTKEANVVDEDLLSTQLTIVISAKQPQIRGCVRPRWPPHSSSAPRCFLDRNPVGPLPVPGLRRTPPPECH